MQEYSQNGIIFFIFLWTQIFRKSLCKISKLFIFVIKIHYFDHIFLVYKDVYWHLKFFCTFPFGFIWMWVSWTYVMLFRRGCAFFLLFHLKFLLGGMSTNIYCLLGVKMQRICYVFCSFFCSLLPQKSVLLYWRWPYFFNIHNHSSWWAFRYLLVDYTRRLY